MRSTILVVLGFVSLLAAAALPGDKPAIAVLNLKGGAGVTAGEADLISDRLRVELFNTGAYTVMERDQMQQILKEQGFQQSGACTDASCMVEIGQLLGVKQLITGSIGRLGSMYLLNLRSIDVTNGKIIKVVSEDVKGDIDEFVGVLPRAAAAFANTTAQARPSEERPDGKVESKPGQKEDNRGDGDKSAISPDCGGRLFLEAVAYTKEQTRLDLSLDDYKDLNENINDKLLDALNEVFNDHVVLATPQQLGGLLACRDPVVRVSLSAYSTKPAKFGQIEGTAEVVLSFFESVAAPSPAFRVSVVKTGDSKRSAAGAFEEAHVAVAEEIEDNLDRQDYVKKLKKTLK